MDEKEYRALTCLAIQLRNALLPNPTHTSLAAVSRYEEEEEIPRGLGEVLIAGSGRRRLLRRRLQKWDGVGGPFQRAAFVSAALLYVSLVICK
ncbi:hypothetical protein ACLOJK_002848 [Asimina triloba]